MLRFNCMESILFNYFEKKNLPLFIHQKVISNWFGRICLCSAEKGDGAKSTDLCMEHNNIRRGICHTCGKWHLCKRFMCSIKIVKTERKKLIFKLVLSRNNLSEFLFG